MQRIRRILFFAFLLSSGGGIPVFAAAESPFAFSWKTDVPLLSVGFGLSLWGTYRYGEMEPRSGEPSKKDLLPWDRPFAGTRNGTADKISDIFALGILVPFAVEGYDLATGNSDAREALTFLSMAAEIALFQNGLNLLVRSARLWPRPEIFDDDADRTKGESWGSFYSGHTSAAFAIAVFSSMWFEEKHSESSYVPLVWGVSLSAAAAVGVLRIAAGKHYPTDVVVGALAGSATSYAIVRLHRNSRVSVTALPGYFGLSVSF